MVVATGSAGLPVTPEKTHYFGATLQLGHQLCFQLGVVLINGGSRMDAISVLVILMAIATFVMLMAGGASMAAGGKFDSLHSFPLMEAAVALQVATVVLMVVAYLFW
jgi:hypothetical protein